LALKIGDTERAVIAKEIYKVAIGGLMLGPQFQDFKNVPNLTGQKHLWLDMHGYASKKAFLPGGFLTSCDSSQVLRCFDVLCMCSYLSSRQNLQVEI